MKVALSCDLFRFGDVAGDAEVNCAWLWPLLQDALAGADCKVVLHSRRDPAIPATVRALRSDDGGDASWPALYSDPAFISLVRDACGPLLTADLVVGHELSPNQLRVLREANVPVLDLSIDPVRFGAELFLRARSSDPVLSRLILRRHVPDEDLVEQARDLRARLGPPVHCTEPAVLFAGQTDMDASLIEGARLRSAATLVEQVRQLIEPGWRILLKPHPYARRHADVLTLHAAIPGSLVVSDNIYALLGAEHVRRVVTLSSGVAAEARLFGKAATTLVRPDRDTMVRHLVEGRVTLRSLQDMLSRRCGGRASPTRASLRQAVGHSWGYVPERASSTRVAAPERSPVDGTASEGRIVGTLGWSTPEPDGCWTDGPLALLLLHPPAPGLEVELKLVPFMPRGHPRLDLDIRGGAAGSVRTTFLLARCRHLFMALPPVAGPVELRFELNGATSPAAYGVSSDRRQLGVKLLRARFARPAHGPARARRSVLRGLHVMVNIAFMVLNLI